MDRHIFAPHIRFSTDNSAGYQFVGLYHLIDFPARNSPFEAGADGHLESLA
jgi:hypothetical protein